MNHRDRPTLAATFVVLSLLAACGGGGGGSGPLPAARPQATVSGAVTAGTISGATVQVFGLATGKPVLLGSGTTDANGDFAVNFNAPSQPIQIVASGGSYTEEADGVAVTLLGSEFLAAVQNYTVGTPLTIDLSYFSTEATGLADYYLGQGMLPQSAVTSADEAVSSQLGFDLGSVMPVDPTSATSATAAITQPLRYGFANAAVSEWTMELGNEYGASITPSPRTVYNSVAFADAAYQDIVADGVLDGKGAGGAVVSFGAHALTTEDYRHNLAIALLSFAASSENRTSLTAAAMVGTAEALDDSTSPIFGDAAAVSIDTGGPAVTITAPAPNTLMTTTVTIAASVSDGVPLSSVTFSLEGDAAGSFTYSPTQFAATPETNGSAAVWNDHSSATTQTLSITATDILGISNTVSEPVLFSNAPAL